MTTNAPESESDPIVADRAQTFLDWTRINSRLLGAGGIVIVVAAAGYWFYMRSREIQASNADKALMSARESLDKGNLPLAQSDLQRVISRYAATPAGLEAGMLLAQMDYDQGKYQDGQRALTGLVGEARSVGSEAALQSLVGDGYMQMNKPIDAAKVYEQAAAAATGLENERAFQQAKAARAYTAGRDTANATRLWKTIADNPSAQSVGAEAQIRLGELTVKPAKP